MNGAAAIPGAGPPSGALAPVELSAAGPLARGHARERVRTAAAAGGLVAIVALSLLLVVMAADRPSLLSATSHTAFFPGWMAGPLGGLWPTLTRNAAALKYIFTGVIVAMYVSYLLALAYAPARLRRRWVIAAILAVHAIFLLAPPMALTDIFNYVNYGRMEIVHHLNPYTTYPVLEPHNDPSYTLSNWHQLLSPYGPLFTVFTFALVPLGVPASFWVIKLVLALTSLATIYLVWRSARLLHLDPVKAVLLVGLNPIVLVWGLGGDHNDFLMVFCIVLGFHLLLRAGQLGAEHPPEPSPEAVTEPHVEPSTGPLRRRLIAFDLAAGAAFVAATALKASGGILLPVVLAGLLRSPRRLLRVLAGMLLAGLLLSAASYAAFGPHIPDLSTQSKVVASTSLPNLLGLALGAGGESETLHTILTLLLALVLA
ncbi:MAG TPA: hypothetical protein VMG62_01850, partial [Solirubrobacteraceae bacterium]|nr:hypothetical protein [Solirubrobacteraceae bacterium]